jgi:hypothetical protein
MTTATTTDLDSDDATQASGTTGEGTASTARGNGAGPSGDAAAAGKDTKGFWPENWREQVAGEDSKVRERLARYASPAEVARALVAAQEKIRSGELRPGITAKSTPEEVAEYRKAAGIPEAPDKYDLDLGGGLVVADADRPLIDTFLEAAHRTNQTPEQVKAGLRAYYEITEAAEAQRSALDESTRTAAEDALRTEWGQDFRPNINRVTQLLDAIMDAPAKTEFLNSRQADGTPIFNNPGIVKAMLRLALIENPAGTVVPSGGGEKGLNDRIKQIEAMMGTAKYTKDEKIQQEYRDLVEARERVEKRR